METFKVYFSDGDSLVTGFNGSFEDAFEYYVGKWFNLGGIINPEEDRMVKGVVVTNLHVGGLK